MSTQSDKEKVVLAALIGAFDDQDGLPSRDEIAALLGRYAVLTNFVDARNEPAIKYLRWLGFRFGVATPWGSAGLPFHPFTMERA